MRTASPTRDIKKANACDGVTLPVATMGPHAAAMGIHFYTGKMFPAEYRNTLFVARKGSWNRTKQFGYDVVTVRVGEDGKREHDAVPDRLHGRSDGTSSGAGRRTSRRCPTARCWCPTSRLGAIYRISYSRPAKAPAKK